eukprot:3033983-Prymnesium_polylepis.2
MPSPLHATLAAPLSGCASAGAPVSAQFCSRRRESASCSASDRCGDSRAALASVADTSSPTRANRPKRMAWGASLLLAVALALGVRMSVLRRGSSSSEG